jgi:hypothetical protein
VLSDIDNIRGEYGETGRADFEEGDPKPDVPETLYRLVLVVDTVGRSGATPLRLDADTECGIAGGVFAP